MSARAASRLELLGFETVCVYRGGKADWTAAGLPVDGAAATRRARDVVRRDVPTCRLDENIADVRARVRAAGWDFCVAVDTDGVVLGLLGPQALDSSGDSDVVDVPGTVPATVRPSIALARARLWLDEQQRERFLVTTSDGRLVGVLGREELGGDGDTECREGAVDDLFRNRER